jgi:hypothetical protein
MKTVDTTNITATNEAPFLKSTFEHINEGIGEARLFPYNRIFGAQYSNGYVIRLQGGEIDVASDTVCNGLFYYNGGVYEFTQASISGIAGSNLRWALDTSYASTDPVLYEDGNLYNQHKNLKLKLVDKTIDSGIGIDYSDTIISSQISSISKTGITGHGWMKFNVIGERVQNLSTPKKRIMAEVEVMFSGTTDGSGSTLATTTFDITNYFPSGTISSIYLSGSGSIQRIGNVRDFFSAYVTATTATTATISFVKNGTDTVDVSSGGYLVNYYYKGIIDIT